MAPPTPEKPPVSQQHGGDIGNEEEGGGNDDGNVDPFDKLAAAISAPATLKVSQALLRRLQRRLSINCRTITTTTTTNKAINKDDINNGDQHYKLMDAAVNSLLKRVMPPPRRSPPSRLIKKQQPTISSPQQQQQQQQFVDRYPPRIFLCAYMILAHPEVVFNTKGDREDSLMEASREMVSRFESLLVHIAQPLITTGSGGVSSSSPLAILVASQLDQITLDDDANANENDEENLSIIVGEEEGGDNNDDNDDEKALSSAEGMGTYLLRCFDEAWVSYLEQFVAWKSADAAGLEAELIRVAVELEVSKLTKLQRMTSNPADLHPLGGRAMAGSGTPKRMISKEDIAALADGVARDLELIEQRVKRLTGVQGAARLHAALVAARANVADLHHQQQQEQSMSMSGSLTSTIIPMSTSSSTSSIASGAGPHTPEHPPAQSFKVNKTNAPPPHLSLDNNNNKNTSSNAEEERGIMRISTTATNLTLLWQLLHDPNWRLPSNEADALWQDAIQPTNNDVKQSSTSTNAITSVADLQLKIQGIADQALWDSIKERLLLPSPPSSSSASASGAAASILAELGSSLCEVLPPQSSLTQEIQSYLNATALERDLSPSTTTSTTTMMVNLPKLFELLEWSGKLLRDLGAPAREQEALAVHMSVRTRLSSAATALASDSANTSTATVKEEMANAVVQALRVLAGQLRLLKLDVANAHLGALVQVLGADGGIAYARSKMEEQGGILGPLDNGNNINSNDGINSRLPHTRGWLALVSSQLPHVEHLLAEAPSSSSTSGDQGVPAQLRSGLRTSIGTGSSSSSSSSSPLLKKVSVLQPCQPRSWQGLVRLGLVSLVAGEGAVNRIAVPEVLRLDTVRLRECQDEFQRLLVLSAAIIIITQSTSSSSSSSRHQQQYLEGIKSRLNAVMVDPNIKLADLACELNIQCGGEPGDATREGVLADSLKRMLSRESPALKSMMAGLTNALIALLVLSGGGGGGKIGGSSGGGQYVAEVALRKCGVLEAVGKEVEGLACKLAGVGGVVESVCQPWLERVCEDLI